VSRADFGFLLWNATKLYCNAKEELGEDAANTWSPELIEYLLDHPKSCDETLGIVGDMDYRDPYYDQMGGKEEDENDEETDRPLDRYCTMKITFFSSESVDTVRSSIEEALQVVAKKHGISVTLGNSVKFYAENCLVTVECAVIRDDGEALTHEAFEYRNRAVLHGLDPALLFKAFTDSDGKRMKLIGFNPKARNAPFVLKSQEGRIYAADEESIRLAVNLPPRVKG